MRSRYRSSTFIRVDSCSLSIALGFVTLFAGCGDAAHVGGTGGVSGTGGFRGGGGIDGAGFSVGYPEDVDIDSHSSVLFYEGFEAPSIAALTERWDSVSSSETMSLASDVPSGAASGSQALQMLVPPGSGTTGVTLFQTLPTRLYN